MPNGTVPTAREPLKAMPLNGANAAHANGQAKQTNGLKANLASPSSSTAPPLPATPSKRSLPHWTRSEIAQRICGGQALVLRHDLVLNVSSWAAYHPGGALALQHFVGRDGADEIAAYHSDATLAGMSRFAVARVHPADYTSELGWAPLSPPVSLGLVPFTEGVKGQWLREGAVRLACEVVDGVKGGADDKVKTTVNNGAPTREIVTLTPEMIEPIARPEVDRRREHERSKAYHKLKARVVDAGLFNPPGPLAGYGSDIVRYSLFFGGAQLLFWTSKGWVGQMASAFCLGLFWWQLTCESSRVISYIRPLT